MTISSARRRGSDSSEKSAGFGVREQRERERGFKGGEKREGGEVEETETGDLVHCE